MSQGIITRRDFLSGAAALGLGGWRLFAAPLGWKHGGKPNLVFGVLSDTHLCSRPFAGRPYRDWPVKYFAAALKHFKSENVDAVVHCGDMAHRGRVRELEFHAEIWRDVFGKHGPTKLFVAGNHEFRADCKGRKLIDDGMAANWERIWGEKYEPVWHKTVKGIHFFGRNWRVDDSCVIEAVDAHFAGTMDTKNPFFVVSHVPLSRALRSAVGMHHNGLGFFGHIHHSAANWNEVRWDPESRLPVVQCPTCHPHGENSLKGDRYIVKCPIEGRKNAGRGRQGYVVKVYDDMLAIERREFGEGGSLGADWVMPFNWETYPPSEASRRRRCPRYNGNGKPGTAKHPFSKGELKKVIGNPQFREGAKLEVENVANVEILPNANIQSQLETDNIGIGNIGNIVIKISLADGNPGSRVYAYEVVVAGDEGTRKLRKAVYAAGCNLGIGHEPNGGVTTLEIPASELPPGESLTIAVRPLTSLGTSGRPIATEFKASGGRTA